METLLVGINAQDNATPVLERFRQTVTSVSNSTVGSFATAGLVFAGIEKGVQMLGAAIKASLGPSAEMEKLGVQFKVLLGSSTEAKARMEELAKFADSTPFELPQVAKASKILQTLTKGTLATGDGLRLVGDAAAAADLPIDEMATTVGRLYDGLQSGRAVGESMSRLQELGLISGDTRGQLEKLQKEGKKGPEVWAVAQKALGEYGGMMAEQANTFSGLASTLQDSVNGALREFGDQVLPDAKDTTKELIETLGDLKPAFGAVGFVVSSTVKILEVAMLGFKAFAMGVIPMVVAHIGTMLSETLKTLAGWAGKVNDLFGGLLPKSWQDNIRSGLKGAEDWASGMTEHFQGVSEEATGYLDTVSGKMADIYRVEDTPDDVKKPKEKSKGSATADDKGAKERQKQIEDNIKLLETITQEHKKADLEIAKIRSQQLLDSITDDKEKELTALAQKTNDAQLNANNNSELLKAIQEKYRQDLAIINKKYDKIEVQERLKAIDKQIAAEEKKQDTIKENLKKSQDDLKEVLDKQQATIDSFSAKASGLLTGPFDAFNKSIMSGNRSLKGSFSDLFSNIQDNFGNMLSNMVAQLMTKAAIFGVLNLLSAGGVGAATTGLSNFSWFASGTKYAYGGPTVVGERGPEILNLPRGSQVIPNNQISNYANRGGDTYNINVSNSNSDPKELVRNINLATRQANRTQRGR